jgi:hypothetical protein
MKQASISLVSGATKLVQASPVLNLFSVVTFLKICHPVQLNDLWRENFFCGRSSGQRINVAGGVPAVAVVGHLVFVPLELLGPMNSGQKKNLVLCSRIAESSFHFDPV